jgi:hypothetical protein
LDAGISFGVFDMNSAGRILHPKPYNTVHLPADLVIHIYIVLCVYLQIHTLARASLHRWLHVRRGFVHVIRFQGT